MVGVPDKPPADTVIFDRSAIARVSVPVTANLISVVVDAFTEVPLTVDCEITGTEAARRNENDNAAAFGVTLRFLMTPTPRVIVDAWS
jgi:hypothetical protein